MKKINLIHNYLVERKLVTETQLEVWTDGIDVEIPVIDPRQPQLGQTYKTQINILIKDFTREQDIRAITLALGWWLNLYEPNQVGQKDRLKVVPYIENRRITEVWIGLMVEEDSHLAEDNTVQSCIYPGWENDAFLDAELKLSDLRIVFKNTQTGEETVLNEGMGDV